MSFTVKIQGIQAIKQAYLQIPQIMNSEMKDALIKSASLVEDSAKHKVPFKEGILMTSIMRPRDPGIGERQVRVGSNLDYAMAQHENLHYKHRRGEAKYLEKALKENESNIRRIFDKMISNIIKRLKNL